jgi:hypothetical protein
VEFAFSLGYEMISDPTSGPQSYVGSRFSGVTRASSFFRLNPLRLRLTARATRVCFLFGFFMTTSPSQAASHHPIPCSANATAFNNADAIVTESFLWLHQFIKKIDYVAKRGLIHAPGVT